MAYAAVQDAVPVEAWILLIGNVFWAIAYDTAYAMVARDRRSNWGAGVEDEGGVGKVREGPAGGTEAGALRERPGCGDVSQVTSHQTNSFSLTRPSQSKEEQGRPG